MFTILLKTILTFAVSVAVSAMLRTLLRTPTGAAGGKAAAELTRREAIASFILILTQTTVSDWVGW